MSTYDTILSQDLNSLGPNELLESCKMHRKALKETSRDLDQLLIERSKHQRICSWPSSISSLEIRPNWIRAEIDSPEDVSSWCCFGERPKFSTLVTYKPAVDSLETQSRKAFKAEVGDCRVIYARLPSKWSNKIYVFAESAATGTISSAKRFRLSTNPTPPVGFVTHWTIFLEDLGLTARIKVWTGRIKWLYILLDTDPGPTTKKGCNHVSVLRETKN